MSDDGLDGLAAWLRENAGYDGYGNDPRWERWADAVDAAADLRERLAAAIEATCDEWHLTAVHAGSDRSRRLAVIDGMRHAARMVRERP